ncbi:MAG: hypothetical protein IKA74_04530 [Clostridia bacterium]|nr:hypothetical protein [Clostridia bacterium]
MSDKTRISYISALISVGAVSLALALWRAFALFSGFDKARGFFTEGSSSAITVVQFFAVFAIVVFSVCIYKKVKLEPVHGGLYLTFSSLFAVVILIVYAILTAISLASLASYRFLYILTVVLALLAIPYFLYNVVLASKKKERQTLFGICCTLLLLLFAVLRFIAGEFMPTSPMNGIELISLALSALFMIYDCRLTMRRENWALHIMTGLSLIVIGFPFSASNIAYMIMDWDVSNYFSLSNFMIFGFSLYAAARLLSFLGYKNLIEQVASGSIDSSDSVYAAHTEKESFTISDERLDGQRAIAIETSSVNESINEKINDATEDAPPKFTFDAPDKEETKQ